NGAAARLVQTVLLDVADDANDRAPRFIVATGIPRHFDSLPDRILVGPEARRQSFADQHYERRSFVVLCGYFTSAPEWNVERLEIAGRRDVAIDHRLVALLHGLEFDLDRRAIKTAGNRQRRNRTSTHNPGQRLNSFR